MYDTELMMIRLLRCGIKGFLKKDIHPEELKLALQQLNENGFYYSSGVAGKMMKLFEMQKDQSIAVEKHLMNDTEITFLQLSTTDLTYKAIAHKMKLNPRAIDNLRDNLFLKLGLKNRVGLAIYAIRNGIVTV